MEIEEIDRGERGAEFYKADLHVHTPGSHDVSDDLITPDEMYQSFIDEDLDLVAVTDHDCSGWYEELSAEEERRNEAVKILPGVEITTAQGAENQIHVTAIFPEDQPNKVEHVLSQIGIDPAEQGEHANRTIDEICRVVQDNEGLMILAHIDGNAGADCELVQGNPIHQSVFDDANVDALEVRNLENLYEYEGFAYIHSSDTHSPEHIGSRYTHIKMETPNFEGLRQALADPESRIEFQDAIYDHPVITGIRVNGQFLDGREAQLNRNLNCLIGGRGTGKSTVIEHIRYAFDIDSSDPRVKENYENLVEKTLGPGGDIEIHVRDKDDNHYIVRRRYEEEPQILNSEGEDLEIPIDTFRERFLDLEIYSQNELQELSRKSQHQLDLLDGYFELSNLKNEEDELLAELSENADQLERKKDKKEELKQEVSELGALKEQKRKLEEEGIDEHIEGHKKWEQERKELEELEESIDDLREEVQELELSEKIHTLDELDDTPNPEILNGLRSQIEDSETNIEEYEQEILDEVEALAQFFESKFEQWQKGYEDEKERYQDLRNKILEEEDIDIDEYFTILDRIEELEEENEELTALEEEIESLEDSREELLNNLEETRSEISATRKSGINEINEQLENVRITIEPQDNRQDYIQTINETLQGSRVQTGDKEEMAENLDPRDFAEAIIDRDVEALIEQGDLTETATENVLEHDAIHDEIYEIQVKKIEDRPIIELMDQNEWKVLNELSIGQQCTALLSIAMLERNYPLIIDQPEDSLDNEFIYSEVVNILRKIKNHRQILIATHNANIPVLGDAEQIFVMHSDGENGYFADRGPIDSPTIKQKAQDILEGGEEAFEERKAKYGLE